MPRNVSARWFSTSAPGWWRQATIRTINTAVHVANCSPARARLRPARLGIAAVGGRRNRAHLPAASLGGRPQRGREESADPANEGGRQHAPRVGVVRIASDERDEAAPLVHEPRVADRGGGERAPDEIEAEVQRTV